MSILDIFRKRTCDDIASEIQKRVTIIANYPPSVPSQSISREYIVAAKALAQRCLKLARKLDHVDHKTVLAIEQKLYLIREADDDTSPETYGKVRTEAQRALPFVQELLKACAPTVVVRPVKHGERQRYVRLMTKAEYKRIVITNLLESSDPDELIPCIVATPKLIDILWKWKPSAIRAFHVKIGGTGSVDIILLFETDVVPEGIIALRKSGFQEVKFRSGTAITIIDHRAV